MWLYFLQIMDEKRMGELNATLGMIISDIFFFSFFLCSVNWRHFVGPSRPLDLLLAIRLL